MALDDNMLDDIADLPAPRRADLAVTTIVQVATRAAKAGAAACRAGRQETALAAVVRHASGLLPTSVTDASLDAWSRLGAQQGIVDGWTECAYRYPKDAPTPEHGWVHSLSYAAAQASMSSVKQGVRRG